MRRDLRERYGGWPDGTVPKSYLIEDPSNHPSMPAQRQSGFLPVGQRVHRVNTVEPKTGERGKPREALREMASLRWKEGICYPIFAV